MASSECLLPNHPCVVAAFFPEWIFLIQVKVYILKLLISFQNQTISTKQHSVFPVWVYKSIDYYLTWFTPFPYMRVYLAMDS